MAPALWCTISQYSQVLQCVCFQTLPLDGVGEQLGISAPELDADDEDDSDDFAGAVQQAQHALVISLMVELRPLCLLKCDV
jgi:hypothetical protein